MPMPNHVLDDLLINWRLSLSSLKVLLYILRWSWGWQNNHWTLHPLSISHIARATGLHRGTVWSSIETLHKAGLIARRQDDRVCLLVESWQQLEEIQKLCG